MTESADTVQAADLAVHAGWVIPVEPEGQILVRHCVVVRDGRILAILPSDEARRRFEPRETIEINSHVLIPGFVNAHTHAATTLLRGLADDLPQVSRLQNYIRAAEARWLGTEFVRDGSELAIAGVLRSGTTCFSDMYFFPDVTAEAVQRNGLRACLGMIVADFPSAWADGPREYIAKGTAVRDQCRSNPLVSFAFTPQAPNDLSESWLREIRALADELDVPIETHLHETAGEIEQSLRQHSQRPFTRLAHLGWLTPNFSAVHMAHTTDSEIAELAHSGAHVVHCPESNLRFANGFCPVTKLLAAGVNVALGTGSAAGNSTLDMLAEMRSAALLAKSLSGDTSVLPAATALRMATLNGARALGLADDVGSLVPGKWADMVAVDLDVPECQPLYNPLSQLVYGASRHQVRDVWVAGAQLLHQGELTRLDLSDVLEHARRWQARIVAATPETG